MISIRDCIAFCLGIGFLATVDYFIAKAIRYAEAKT
jgi:hypothetical protein